MMIPLFLLAACQDNEVGVYNTPPTVSVLSPADAAFFNPGALVEFYGAAEDAQDSASALTIRWESDIDGVIGEDPADGEGNLYLATNGLTGGDHVITLTAVDTNAESASTSITITVAPGIGGPGSPAVVLLGPTPGQRVGPSEVLNVVAAVTDVEDPFDTILCELIDVPQGSLWTGSPSATGSLTVPLSLSPGVHSLTLNAIDSDGNVGSAAVSFEVLEDGRPVPTITSPLDGANYDLGQEISFRGTVSDDATPVELLSLVWSSDVSGTIATTGADSSGATSTAGTLPAGIHTILLSATDEGALTGSASVVIVVTDPLTRDDDGDGWTENDGDCDDTELRVNPDATDLCDDLDNDCSGSVNDDFWDGYELNDTSATSYDCGEVDLSLGWSNSAITLSGLTLSTEDDEDWFTWDADDAWYDNVTVSVSVTGLPPGGTYVVELLDVDGRVVDSESGSSALSLSHTGDPVDDDEDDWTVRVYALTWPSNSCATTYSIVIRS